jgi:predicted dehydrogenase
MAGIRVMQWAPSPGGDDHTHCARLARHFNARFAREWRTVTDNPGLPAIVVFGTAAPRIEAIAAALTAGKFVMCPFPIAPDTSSLAMVAEARGRGGGILLTIDEIASTAAGARLLETLQSRRIGKLHSIWAATRSRRVTMADADVTEQHGWPLLDFLLMVTSAPPLRVHSTAAHLFEPGPHPDTAVVLLRFEEEMVATLEMARCLCPLMPVPSEGEVEVEAVGKREVVRIEPYNAAVRVYGDRGVSMRSLADSIIVRALPQMVDAVRSARIDESPWKRTEWAITIMDTIRMSTSVSAAQSGA